MDDGEQSESDRALTELLESRLPRHVAPLHLKRRLAEGWPSADRVPERQPWGLRVWSLGLAMAASIAVVGGAAVLVLQHEREAALSRLNVEAVNDHLHILGGTPLAQVTGGLHEVKPWFGGKLDFAPAVAFAGDADFPLQGGAVEEFLERRVAVFVFKRRLHTASLFVMDAEGRTFPSSLQSSNVRGFNVAIWKGGSQGYALVSDLNLPELLELQKRIAQAGQ